MEEVETGRGVEVETERAVELETARVLEVGSLSLVRSRRPLRPPEPEG